MKRDAVGGREGSNEAGCPLQHCSCADGLSAAACAACDAQWLQSVTGPHSVRQDRHACRRARIAYDHAAAAAMVPPPQQPLELRLADRTFGHVRIPLRVPRRCGIPWGCTAGTSTREAALPRAYTIRKCNMRSCPSIGPTSLPVCTRAAEHCGIACGISDGGSCLPVRPGREPRLLLLNQVCEYRSIGRRANRSIRSLNERSRHCQSCATRNACSRARTRAALPARCNATPNALEFATPGASGA